MTKETVSIPKEKVFRVMEIPGLVMEIGGFDTETAPLTIFSTQKWRFLYTKQLRFVPK